MCLLAFAHSHRISAETECLDRAADLAVTGCETVKAHRGDLKTAGEILDGEIRKGILLVTRHGLRMEIQILDPEFPHLGRAEVLIFPENTDEPIYSLTVSWQEVSP